MSGHRRPPAATTITLNAGAAPPQIFTITTDAPPTFGATSGNSTFTVGKAGNFTVSASGGVPTTTTFTKSGTLPKGLVFSAKTNGTAVISGTPAAGAGGTYNIAVTRQLGARATKTTQIFTLTVNQAPAFTSAASATFVVGQFASFKLVTTGFPAPALTAPSLPAGLSFTDNHDGTGTISGIPEAGTGRSLPTSPSIAGNAAVTIARETAASRSSSISRLVFTQSRQAPFFTTLNRLTFTFAVSGFLGRRFSRKRAALT